MEDALIVLATASPAIAAVAGFFAAAWWSSNLHVRRLESILREKHGTGERDDNLERALTAIEDHVDRIREDREFLMRLVADANAKPAASLPREAADWHGVVVPVS
jgi:hypothetical protein